MISASHNQPWIMGLNSLVRGFKLSDQQEEKSEKLCDAPEDTLPRPRRVPTVLGLSMSSQKGSSSTCNSCNRLFLAIWKAFVSVSTQPTRLQHLWLTNSSLIWKLTSTPWVTVPNSINISDGVGSTHPRRSASLR